MSQYVSIEEGINRNKVASGDRLVVYSGGAIDVESGGAIRIGGVDITTELALDGLTSSVDELNILDGVTATAAELNLVDNQVAAAVMVVGTETGGDTINVAIQLNDAAGAAMATRSCVMAYLSADENGDSVITTAHSTSPAIGADGVLMPLIADKVFLLTSEADGDIDIDFVEAGALGPYYLVVVLPNGSLNVSGAITHAE